MSGLQLPGKIDFKEVSLNHKKQQTMKKQKITTCRVTVDGKACDVVIEWKLTPFDTPELVKVRYQNQDVTDRLDAIALATCKEEVYRASIRRPISEVVQQTRENTDPDKMYPDRNQAKCINCVAAQAQEGCAVAIITLGIAIGIVTIFAGVFL